LSSILAYKIELIHESTPAGKRKARVGDKWLWILGNSKNSGFLGIEPQKGTLAVSPLVLIDWLDDLAEIETFLTTFVSQNLLFR
jgi:hypothetical protein